MKKIITIVGIIIASIFPTYASYLLIPMDEVQKNHLKSYGVAYWILAEGGEVSLSLIHI